MSRYGIGFEQRAVAILERRATCGTGELDVDSL